MSNRIAFHISSSVDSDIETISEEEKRTKTLSSKLKKEQEMTTISGDLMWDPENNEDLSIIKTEITENMLSSNSSSRPENNENIGSTGSPRKPGKPLKRSASTPYLEDKLRRELKFFFMGPHQKIMARKKCPWKLSLQIVKVILVTVQLCLFGFERSLFVEYVEKNNIALRHLYLKDWNPGYETLPYPPATGPYAVYNKYELFDHINYAMEKYNQTEDLGLAVLQLIRTNGSVNPMKLCSEHYSGGTLYENGSFNFYSEKYNDCLNVYPVQVKDNQTGNIIDSYDIVKYLSLPEVNKTYVFHRVIKLTLQFNLRSYRLNAEGKKLTPECFVVHGKITFDDSNRDGQMVLDLDTELEEKTCHGKYNDEDQESLEKILKTIYDAVVICVSLLSTILCLRSLYRGHKLMRRTVQHFKVRYRKDLPWSDQFEFINLWYVVIVINDVFTVIGSSFKIQIENKETFDSEDLNAESTSENYDNCSLFLGAGSILVWLGVLRYLGFFKTFNILSLVLKKAFPNMVRFLVCALMLYVGFTFCGWVVLGPYHIKFRQMSSSAECLFALINGDDMFATFSAMQTKNQVVWYFSRIFLYIFISLFIYCVLNLFIAVILDTYETIKAYYAEGFPKSELTEFIDQCHDPPSSSLYRGEDKGCGGLLACLCCHKRNADKPAEYTSLL